MRLLFLSFLFASCSTTDSLPEGEKLYVGLKEISYGEHERDGHFEATQEELDAALQTAPNGALFGSSYYRTPFPYGLWIWNAFHDRNTAFAKWMTKSFGKQPVLMSNVNPALRSQVATNILRNNGYFNGKVTYDIIDTKNPRKQKISYHVETGEPCLIDTLAYMNFPEYAEQLIENDTANSLIHHATPFTTAVLDAERNRVTRLLRNSGYYYYQPSFASYLADTINRSGWAALRLQMADSIPEEAQRPWHIGDIKVTVKRQAREKVDTVKRKRTTDQNSRKAKRRSRNRPGVNRVPGNISWYYAGDKSPVRRRVIRPKLDSLDRHPLYSYEKHSQVQTALASLGLFSNVDFQFSPRVKQGAATVAADSVGSLIPVGSLISVGGSLPDTLDLAISCILDRPYSFYVQGNYIHKLSGRMGPELKVGITKNNAFRGGEKFDVNLHSTYLWEQQGTRISSGNRNSYEVGMDASVEWPRLLIPFLPRRSYAISPATKMTGSFNIINRPGYYRMHTASGEWSYIWKPSLQTTHQFSPLILTYQRLNHSTEKFDSIVANNLFLLTAMQNMFIPKMQYSYTYVSKPGKRNPISLNVTLTESGNFTSLFNKVFFGQSFKESEKTMFKNVYSQFLKVETDFRKTWRLTDDSQLVAHAGAGLAWAYGNMDEVPYTEQFYLGGANSVRAFSARSLGPGRFYIPDRTLSYICQTGDVLLLFNLEYRKRLFSSLYGAVFLDAGNVWELKNREQGFGETLKLKNLPKDMALGTGIGFRYDLDFLVLRLDWGVGLHAPYDTGKSGYYNFRRFKDSHTLHFAIGYPF